MAQEVEVGWFQVAQEVEADSSYFERFPFLRVAQLEVEQGYFG